MGKRWAAVLLALVLTLGLTACGSREETKKLAGTWRCTVDVTELIADQLAQGLEMDIDTDARCCMYMAFDVDEAGAYRWYYDAETSGAAVNAYLATLTPALKEAFYRAAEEEGTIREEYDAILEKLGMSIDELAGSMLQAVDMATLLRGGNAEIGSGWCKAEEGRLYVSAAEGNFTGAAYVDYTLGDGTMTWQDPDGSLSAGLSQETLAVLDFPLVWERQNA